MHGRKCIVRKKSLRHYPIGAHTIILTHNAALTVDISGWVDGKKPA